MVSMDSYMKNFLSRLKGLRNLTAKFNTLSFNRSCFEKKKNKQRNIKLFRNRWGNVKQELPNFRELWLIRLGVIMVLWYAGECLSISEVHTAEIRHNRSWCLYTNTQHTHTYIKQIWEICTVVELKWYVISCSIFLYVWHFHNKIKNKVIL